MATEEDVAQLEKEILRLLENRKNLRERKFRLEANSMLPQPMSFLEYERLHGIPKPSKTLDSVRVSNILVILDVLQLSGIRFLEVQDSLMRIALCFSVGPNCYTGYQIDISRIEDDEYEVTSASLPGGLDLPEIVEKVPMKSNEDVIRFLRFLHICGCALFNRKEQVENLRKNWLDSKFEGNVTLSRKKTCVEMQLQSHDFMHIANNEIVKFILKYNIDSRLPTKVTYEKKNISEEDKLHLDEVSKHFLSLDLKEAFRCVLDHKYIKHSVSNKASNHTIPPTCTDVSQAASPDREIPSQHTPDKAKQTANNPKILRFKDQSTDVSHAASPSQEIPSQRTPDTAKQTANNPKILRFKDQSTDVSYAASPSQEIPSTHTPDIAKQTESNPKILSFKDQSTDVSHAASPSPGIPSTHSPEKAKQTASNPKILRFKDQSISKNTPDREDKLSKVPFLDKCSTPKTVHKPVKSSAESMELGDLSSISACSSLLQNPTILLKTQNGSPIASSTKLYDKNLGNVDENIDDLQVSLERIKQYSPRGKKNPEEKTISAPLKPAQKAAISHGNETSETHDTNVTKICKVKRKLSRRISVVTGKRVMRKDKVSMSNPQCEGTSKDSAQECRKVASGDITLGNATKPEQLKVLSSDKGEQNEESSPDNRVQTEGESESKDEENETRKPVEELSTEDGGTSSDYKNETKKPVHIDTPIHKFIKPIQVKKTK